MPLGGSDPKITPLRMDSLPVNALFDALGEHHVAALARGRTCAWRAGIEQLHRFLQ